jgi:hypothetical protein
MVLEPGHLQVYFKKTSCPFAHQGERVELGSSPLFLVLFFHFVLLLFVVRFLTIKRGATEDAILML